MNIKVYFRRVFRFFFLISSCPASVDCSPRIPLCKFTLIFRVSTALLSRIIPIKQSWAFSFQRAVKPSCANGAIISTGFSWVSPENENCPILHVHRPFCRMNFIYDITRLVFSFIRSKFRILFHINKVESFFGSFYMFGREEKKEVEASITTIKTLKRFFSIFSHPFRHPNTRWRELRDGSWCEDFYVNEIFSSSPSSPHNSLVISTTTIHSAVDWLSKRETR